MNPYSFGNEPNCGGDEQGAPTNPTYSENLEKAQQCASLFLRDLQDAHAKADTVAAEILLLGWLEQIVKIRQGLNRLKAETKKVS